MASKRLLHRALELAETEVANERSRTAVANGERDELANERDSLRDQLADTKAAWNHDKAQRDEAQNELTELRRQLAKIRDTFNPLYKAIYPESYKTGVFGGTTLPSIAPGVSWNG